MGCGERRATGDRSGRSHCGRLTARGGRAEGRPGPRGKAHVRAAMERPSRSSRQRGQGPFAAWGPAAEVGAAKPDASGRARGRGHRRACAVLRHKEGKRRESLGPLRQASEAEGPSGLRAADTVGVARAGGLGLWTPQGAARGATSHGQSCL